MQLNSYLWLFAPILAWSLSAGADDVLDEIKVTADYRERSLSDVPFSVSAMNADLISAAAVQHFEELVDRVPNMNWSGDGNRARYFQIRGVGELEQYEGAPNPSVGFLIDDIDFSGIGGIATLFDVDRVEVLRGSQGSRYGANALGGLVYVRSKAPSVERDGRAQLTLGGDDTRALAAAFGGAIKGSGSASYRVSAQRFVSNGFRHNAWLNRDDTNGRDETTLRGRAHFDAAENLAADVSVLYARLDNGYDAFALDNSNTVLSDKPGKDAQESLGAALRLEWPAFDDLTATSITSVARSTINFSFDADWGNAESWAPYIYDYVSSNDRERRTASQEFRLGSERWLIGIYTLNLVDQIATLNSGEYYDPFLDWSDSLNDSLGSDYDATNVAVFGQYDHDLTATTRISTGLRVEHRKTDYSDTTGLRAGPSESMWGGEFGISHSLNDGTAYATLSKGYRAGGFNLGVVPAGNRDFVGEDMWTLEAGINTALLHQRLRLNAAIFQYRRINQQVRASTQLVPGDPASFVFFTANAGAGEARGIEIDARWYPADEWELYATLGLIDATLQGGREQAHAPRYTLASGVSYRSLRGFFARLDASAKDSFYFDVSHDQQSQPYHLFNGRAGYESETWLAALWVKNLLDERYAVRGFYFGNEPPDFPATLYTRSGDSRQVGITIERRF